MFDQLEPLKLRALEIGPISKSVKRKLQDTRKESGNARMFMVCRASELTREIQIVADCGLQKDVRKKITEGHLSYNQAWQDLVGHKKDITRVSMDAPWESALGIQLGTIFANHKIALLSIVAVRCSVHELVVFVEAIRSGNTVTSCWDEVSNTRFTEISEKIYFAYLNDFRTRHVTDWERVVHELASPLDFIYSNSNFLKRYLTDDRISKKKKTQKLEDFGRISQLLIDRLHQFRFAFAGADHLTVKIEYVNLFNLFMPITHLFHHDAKIKKIKFGYDDLRGIHVNTDKNTIRFIFFNLISNAIKYSDRNSKVMLSARPHRKEGWAVLAIKNRGLEISEVDRERIFHSGFRADAAMRTDPRGMGIGLNVCRQLARKLGGNVVLADSAENWNTFEVHIPGWPMTHDLGLSR